MSSDELSRKDLRLLDGMKLASAAHEEGRREGLEEAYARAREADSLEAFMEDLLGRIAELAPGRPEDL